MSSLEQKCIELKYDLRTVEADVENLNIFLKEPGEFWGIICGYLDQYLGAQCCAISTQVAQFGLGVDGPEQIQNTT
jgi:hypothetical protein